MATRQSVFEITQNFRDFDEMMKEKQGECSDEQYNYFKALKMTGEEKITQMYFLIQQKEAEAGVAKEAEVVAANHRKRREDQIVSMKKMIVALACELQIKKLDTPHMRMTVCDGRTTLDIPDVTLLDSDYVETVTITSDKPLKDKIEADLKAGKEVLGAGWKTGDPFLKFTKAKGE